MRLRRLLFASNHGYLDPSSGAACASRDVLELLSAHGVECQVISTGVLDYDRETPLGPIVASVGGPSEVSSTVLANGETVKVFDFTLGGVSLKLLPTTSSFPSKAPNSAESKAFLILAEQALARFRPQILLTYGGHPANLELMARARRQGVPVVFHLHNLAYEDRNAFANTSSVLVPSEFSRRFYAQRLGLTSVAIPSPLVPARVVAPTRDPKYLTFINPLRSKGAAVFARIAAELHARRPEIPLMVVEGRGMADGLAQVKMDLSELRNLHRLPNTPNPRAIYRQTRAILAPSLVQESFGRMASEALANGIPVLASDRGALPETLGEAGFVFTLPERCTPSSYHIPTAQEVAPWIATIERLWDDPAWEAAHQAHARASAQRFMPSILSIQYLAYFESFIPNG